MHRAGPVRMKFFTTYIMTSTMLLFVFARSTFAEPSDTDNQLSTQFTEVVRPFLSAYCIRCHGPEKSEAQLNLTIDENVASVVRDQRRWQMVLERLEAGEMPPDDAPRHPTDDERQAIVDWIGALRKSLIEKTAGDPGPVLPRRLSNAEYNYTIRDLTGVDLRPASEFPVDPANESGFGNSGESLSMSPDLLQKYLAAARLVADHLALTPDGFVFAPHPVVTETDRDKFCVQRIVDFYHSQPTDLADYFQAAYRFARRDQSDRSTTSLNELARDIKISGKYLTKVWSVLEECQQSCGPLAELQSKWRELCAAEMPEDQLRQQCQLLRDFVVQRRRALQPKIESLKVEGISTGSQPLVLWKDRQMAANRLRYVGPASDIERPSFERFCETFPDDFYIAERKRVFLEEDDEAEGRLLSAGFHLMVGYFRDDGPLCELILDENDRQELDRLWSELDYITLAPIRQYKDFLFFERAEPPRFMKDEQFDFARPENKDSVTEENVNKLSEVYLAKAQSQEAGNDSLEAMKDYFTNINVLMRGVENAHQGAEPIQLEALQKFAQRAYRRPLNQEEKDELITFYHALRSEDGLNHEDALRDCIVSVLMSPYFCYLVNLPPPGSHIQPLPDSALASRLSYFLWSSMPDDQLLARAAANQLHQPEILIAETRRMLADQQVRGLATEFAGDWLDFRGFEQHNAVDRTRFPEFTDQLREAMYQEPIQFFIDVAQQNRSVLDFLYADRTFVNGSLAQHYGMDLKFVRADQWLRVDDASRYGRGGLLPMSIFLTKNAPGLRTSPVKRGYWVVRRLLGERIPPPPPTVPELPKDEAQLGELNLRQVLARHRDNKSCAGCHQRFDSIGLAFEGYGPVGERRDQDLGGKPVDAQAIFPDGSEGVGLEGLRNYLRQDRQQDYLDVLCRKMFAYALGRGLQLSDEPAVEEIRAKLEADDYRFGTLIEMIVTRPQFLNQRGRDYDNSLE